MSQGDEAQAMTPELERALEIAKSDILGNIAVRTWRTETSVERSEVLLAGRTKFPEVWARDAAFAVPALLSLGRQRVVRDTLQAFFDLQHPDGGFPRRLSGTSNLGRNLRAGLRNWFGFALAPPGKLRPEFLTSGSRLLWHRGRPKDVTPLILWATAAYCAATGDLAFARQRKARIRAALAATRRDQRDDLLWQHHFEDWEDHTRHSGHGLYTNVLHYQALRDLAATDGLWSPEAGEELVRWARAVRHGLERFWIEEVGYFAPFIGRHSIHTVFSIAGNMLAILSGLATPTQRDRIADHLEAVVGEYGYVPIVAPGLPLSMTEPLRALFVRHYLSGRLLLPWIQLLAARAMAPWRPGFALRLAQQVAQPFVGHGSSLEALHEGRTPLRYVFSTQEHHFTWGSAALIETCAALDGKGPSPGPRAAGTEAASASGEEVARQ